MDLLTVYHQDIKTKGILYDPVQEKALSALQNVADQLAHTKKRWFWQKKSSVKGLYLWGGVGRGKTYIMDCFYQNLSFPQKIRMHFYRFMEMIHAELRNLQGHENPLQLLADKIALEARVICFDEFVVTDIADAMILGLLFKYLFGAGVTLVTTSNLPPDKLYENGLQREQFLPAIALVKQYTEVMQVDAGIDYRCIKETLSKNYFTPLQGEQAWMQLQFESLSHHEPILSNDLIIMNRPVQAIKRTAKVAWFDFKVICTDPRAPSDYIEIANIYEAVLVSNVPKFTENNENEARRFIALVDELYDSKIKLILSAELPIKMLYQGHKLQFEFQRTVSRIEEYQQ